MAYEFDFVPSKKEPWTDEQRREAAHQIRWVADTWNTMLNRHEQDHDTASPLGAELLKHVSPSFVGKADNFRADMSWSTLRQCWLDDAKVSPKARLEIQRLSTYVDEEKGTAIAYQEQRASGLGAFHEMKTFSEMRFELQDGKWIVVRFHVMRGHVGLGGFV